MRTRRLIDTQPCSDGRNWIDGQPGRRTWPRRPRAQHLICAHPSAVILCETDGSTAIVDWALSERRRPALHVVVITRLDGIAEYSTPGIMHMTAA